MWIISKKAMLHVLILFKKSSEKYEIPSNLLDISIKMGGSYIQFNGEKYVNVSKTKGYHLYD